jgi:hypothetical protein
MFATLVVLFVAGRGMRWACLGALLGLAILGLALGASPTKPHVSRTWGPCYSIWA